MSDSYAFNFRADGTVEHLGGQGQPSPMMQLLVGRVQAMLAQRDAQDVEITDTQVMPDTYEDNGGDNEAFGSQAIQADVLDLLADSQPQQEMPGELDLKDDALEDADPEVDDKDEDALQSKGKVKTKTPTKYKKMKSKQFHGYKKWILQSDLELGPQDQILIFDFHGWCSVCRSQC